MDNIRDAFTHLQQAAHLLNTSGHDDKIFVRVVLEHIKTAQERLKTFDHRPGPGARRGSAAKLFQKATNEPTT